MDDFETAKQLFIQGMQLIEVNNFQAAELQFVRSLELMPDRVSTLNNLSAVKIRLNQFAEAEALSRRAVAIDKKSHEAWSNLGFALTKLKRNEEALRACDQALRLNSGRHEVLYAKSLILKELNRLEEAKKIYVKSLEMRSASSPVFIAERRPTQKGEVLVINQNPVIDTSLMSYEDLHLQMNFPGQLARRFCEDFHFAFVFKGDAASDSVRQQIPPPDFVINNNASGELVLSDWDLLGLSGLVDSFGVPVVNHPAKVVQTTRDESAKLLDGLSGIIVPKTMRFTSVEKPREELIREIESQYDYPIITRTLARQEGKGMTKVDSRDALVGLLASACPENFYVTKFVDSRDENKFYRKIRAAVVKDDIIIVRADYDTSWNVHGRKSDERVAFYLGNAHLLDEEKQICANPEVGLGRSAMQALRAIRGRIPLDVFGVDFDVDADGSLIFYEANATMNLLSTAREEVPYPKDADDRLQLAFQRYFTSLINTKGHRSLRKG